MQSPSDLLRAAFENPSLTQEAAAKLSLICRDADTSTCRQVIAHLKAVIKNNSADVPVKLTALEILHICAQSGSLNFFSALGNKFIKRLAIMASHRIDSDDPERGRDLFGKLSLKSEQSRRASVLFLQKLLRYFVCWAKSIEGTQNRGAARIKRVFDELERRGLNFPRQEADLSEALMQDMAKCYRAISRLYSLMDNGGQDTSRLKRYGDKVMAYKTQIETEVQHLSDSKTSPAHLEVLIRTNDDLEEAVKRYTEFRGHNELSSVDLINLLDSPVRQSPVKRLQAAGVHREAHVEIGRLEHEPSYLDELMELSMQVYCEPPPAALRNAEPIGKAIPRTLPASPKTLRKRRSFFKAEERVQQQLNSDFTILFESGRGALEEEYSKLVICRQQARFDELEEAYYAQAKTIEFLKSELTNANETIIVQREEKEALKDIIRTQDTFKKQLDEAREELGTKEERIEEYQLETEGLKASLHALQSDTERQLKGDRHSDIEPDTVSTQVKLNKTDERRFDFSTDDLQSFLTAPPGRFSFDQSYDFVQMKPFTQSPHTSNPFIQSSPTSCPFIESPTTGPVFANSSESSPPQFSKGSPGVPNAFEMPIQWDFSKALVSTSTAVLAYDNLEFFANGCCCDTSVIYDDDYVQVGFKLESEDFTSGVVWLYLGNKSQLPLQNIDCKLLETPGLTTSLDSDGRGGEVQSRDKFDFKLNYRFTSYFKSPPVLQVSFTINSIATALNLKLPLVSSRFLQPSVFTPKEFEAKWLSCSKSERQCLIMLRSSIKTLEDLIWVMRLSNHFQVITDASTLLNCKLVAAAHSGIKTALVKLDLEANSLRVSGSHADLIEVTEHLLREVLEGR